MAVFRHKRKKTHTDKLKNSAPEIPASRLKLLIKLISLQYMKYIPVS